MENNSIKINKLPEKLLHGGDYNPDQWLDKPDILKEDIELMKKAHINCVTLGVFAWSRLEPEEGRYDFDWLEKIMDDLYANGIYTILATPTGAMPRWLTDKYEEVNKVDIDNRRHIHGERHNFCPSSPVMRQKMHDIDSELSKRFGKHPGLIAWHISNEYGGDLRGTACHCPHCQNAFREWLKARYKTIDNLNHAWWTSFWSNIITDWSEIHSPFNLGESGQHGINLDWKRFTSAQMLDFCQAEIKAVRENSDLPATTNFMGAFKPLDYYKWGSSLDFTSFDSYPAWHMDENGDDYVAAETAFYFTLTRCLKKQPFLLMESTPSAVNWRTRNVLKRPGMHELSSLQAIAHGARSVQYFQWRKGRGGTEKYHGAVIDHKNGENTRVFSDVTKLGIRLENLSEKVLKTFNKPKIAVIFDWECWWAADDAAALAPPFNYLNRVFEYFRVFWQMGIDVDLVDMDYELNEYSLVIAPVNYMYRGSYVERVKDYVKNGGTYVTTYWSGEVDDSDLCFNKHPLCEVLGIRTEETDVRPLYVDNHLLWGNKAYAIKDLCSLVHSEGAEVLGVYEQDFYKGRPALTKNKYGKGTAYYIAAECGADFIKDLYSTLIKETNTEPSLNGVFSKGVTVTERKGLSDKDSSLWFVQNYNCTDAYLELYSKYVNAETKAEFVGRITLSPYECLILEQP